MQGRWISIIILFMLVAALGGWVWWQAMQPEAEKPTLTTLDPQSLQHITIVHGDKHMEFQRQGDRWQMLRPYTAPADDYHMEQVLDLLKATSYGQYSIPEDELQRFGLQPPRAVVRLDGHAFHFGNQNPIDFRRYVQVDQGPLHLIDDTLFHLLTSPASDWVDTRLLPSTAIRALELPDWRIHLTEKGSWTAEPAVDDASLRQLVEEWRNARALSISPYSDTPPPDAPVIRVQLQDQTVSFVILQQAPELILLRPDLKLRYHFYGQIGRRLLQPAGNEAESPS